MNFINKKIAIVGSRVYPDLEQVKKYIATLPKDTIIVSGGARGVDKTAELTAIELNMPKPLIFLPDYDKYGRHQAPLIRNTQIVQACDELVAFHDGISRGTLDAIKKAIQAKKPVKILTPNENKDKS